MKVASLQPQYVEFIPKKLDSGILYIAQRFQTASHLCACGCGTKIVTPLRNSEYVLTQVGGRVSLFPSIGNWSHPCQSHYWIKENAVIWAGAMSKEQIRAGRSEDDALRADYFSSVAWPWYRRAASRISAWWKRLLEALHLG